MKLLNKLLFGVGALALSSNAFADPVVFGHNVVNASFTATSYTLIPASTNTNGAVIQTLTMGCNSVISVVATPPNGTAVTFLYCVGAVASSAATLPAPVYIPAGWSVTITNNNTTIAGVAMTYDLK